MQALFVGTGKAHTVKDLVYTPSGTAVLSWSFAQKVGYGDNVRFDWYTASMFGTQAEKLNGKIQKDTRFFVVGRQSINSYTKNDGTAGVSIKVDVIHFEFLGDAPKKNEEEEEEVAF